MKRAGCARSAAGAAAGREQEEEEEKKKKKWKKRRNVRIYNQRQKKITKKGKKD